MDKKRLEAQFEDGKEEKILCAALLVHPSPLIEEQVTEESNKALPFNVEDGSIVICGWRHHNCFATLHQITQDMKVRPVEGFLTNKNRFLNRLEAWALPSVKEQARRYKNIALYTNFPYDSILLGGRLTTEDLY